MPNRVIKDSILASDTLDQLTGDEERFFYRLLLACDDFGRFEARPVVVKARCFPLKEGLSAATVAEWLASLQRVGLVDIYDADGRLFLQMKSWAKHNKVRAKESKYPAPGRICPQMTGLEVLACRPSASASTCKQTQTPADMREQMPTGASGRQHMSVYTDTESDTDTKIPPTPQGGPTDADAPSAGERVTTDDATDGDRPQAPPSMAPASPEAPLLAAIAPSSASEPTPPAAGAPSPDDAPPRGRRKRKADRTPEEAAAAEAERADEQADGERWRDACRALGYPDAELDWSRGLWMAFRRARREHGIETLVRATLGLKVDPFARSVGAPALLSEALIRKGLAADRTGGHAAPATPRPASHVPAAVDEQRPPPEERRRRLAELKEAGALPTFASGPMPVARRREERLPRATPLDPEAAEARRAQLRRQSEEVAQQETA